MKKTVYFLITMTMVHPSFSQNTRSVDEAKGLQIGTKAPVFKAIGADTKTFELSNALKDGPVVIIFYRGFWCPVCNKHLRQMQDSLLQITDRGSTIVALSPEKPEFLNKMVEKTSASFRLLYDEGYKISNAYDVTFTPKKSELIFYNTGLKAKLKKTHSDDSQRLPIPATYIIDKNGIIIWRQFNPNYKLRSTAKEILENLPQ